LRDIVLIVVILGSLPFALLKPYVGIYLWYWVGFMNPHRYTYSFMYFFPVAQAVGGATILGSFFVKRRAPLFRSPEIAVLLVLVALFTFNTLFALFATAWHEWEKVMKVLLMTFFTVVLIDQRSKLRMLLMVVVVSIGFVAAKGAIWGVLTGAQYRLWGPPGSTLEDNNAMGLALNMIVPLALFLANTERRIWTRLLFYGLFLSSVFGVFLTYSRGALLGLAAIIGMLLYQARRNVAVIIAFTCLFLVILAFIPSRWFERMQTIETFEEDESAMSRLQTWEFAWDLALQRPVTGGGFEGFRANPTNQNPHSIYFGMLGEQGFVALGLFLLLLAMCYRNLGRFKRLSMRQPGLRWYGECATMIRISLVGYAVSGAFLNLQYFDLFYLEVAMTAILRNLLTAEVAASAPAEGTVLRGASREALTSSGPRRGASPAVARATQSGM
jgi:putative inorganic carbon (HCO3(-)) transporter